MQGTIDFRSFGTDRDARRIGVFHDSAISDPEKYRNTIAPSNTVELYTNCKFTDDFEQTIIVPYFDAWRTVDTVLLYPDGALPDSITTTDPFELSTFIGIYFITNRRYSSLVNGAIEFDLLYNPVTSKLTIGTSITGDWVRASANIAPWKGQHVMSGAMVPSRIITLDGTEIVTNSSPVRYLFWVQITASKSVLGTADSPTVYNDTMTVYGLPIAVPANANLLGAHPLVSSYQQIKVGTASSHSDYRFPTIGEIISTPEILGLTASDITDISISRMCPYYYTSDISSSDSRINVFSIEGLGVVTRSYSDKGYNDTFCVYNIGSATGTTGSVYRQVSGTITLTDMEMDCCSIGVRDANGSIIADIPTAWFDSSNQLTFAVQVHADYGQLYYHIGFDTATDIGTRTTLQIPCSHLPYLSSAWTQYKAYSQSFDREAMQYSIDQANTRLMADAAIKAGTGVVSGISGIAGIAAQAFDLAMSNDAMRFSQNLKERRIQSQPSTVYNTAYGISYIRNLIEHPQAIVISMPANLTSTIYNNYISDYGYAVEGRATITLGQRFTQGTMFSDPSLGITGEILNRMNEELRNGIKTVVIT